MFHNQEPINLPSIHTQVFKDSMGSKKANANFFMYVDMNIFFISGEFMVMRFCKRLMT